LSTCTDVGKLSDGKSYQDWTSVKETPPYTYSAPAVGIRNPAQPVELPEKLPSFP